RQKSVTCEHHGDAVTLIRATHTAEDGFDIFFNRDRLPTMFEVLTDAGARSVSKETFETLRIEAGAPRFGRDMDETNVVTETNLDDAVSYTKGCYLGQEIIVRIKHRGHVAKKLTGLRIQNGGRAEPGSVIKSADGKEIGKLTSTAFSPKLEATIA